MEHLELLDWRRRVAELFVDLRRRPADAETLAWFRARKDELFRAHPQSPIPAEERPGFPGLVYWPHSPQARVVAQFTSDPGPPAPADTPIAFTRIGQLAFDFADAPRRLPAFWIAGYAGGLFVPFRDATSGAETYGGGRYLVDSIKSADLGTDFAAKTVILDFNYAYHPSCAYDPSWVCPLAPPESRLPVPVYAGERLPTTA
jgi:uncharacterized protein (DUF1684 family)